jgi:hypothetical protein
MTGANSLGAAMFMALPKEESCGALRNISTSLV